MAKLTEPAEVPGLKALDGGTEGEIEQPIGVLPGITSHQVEGVAIDAGGRYELAHGRGFAVGAPDHRHQQTGVTGIEHPSQHHGEPALVLSLSAESHEGGQLLGELGGYAGRIMERNRIALLLDAVMSLA